MSQLVFNNYTHAVDSVGIKIDNRMIEDKQKRPLIRVCRWTIVGTLRSDGSSGDLQIDMNNLESAYGDGGQNYGNATFTANGHTHVLRNDTAFSGGRVAAFGWTTGPWKMHTELSNRRSFYAILQAEYRFSTQVVSYTEQVEQIGNGGPKWRFMPSLIGEPQAQVLQVRTPVKYVQRGSLTYRSSMPSAPSSMFLTSHMHHDQTRIRQIAPMSITKNGTVQTNELYTVTWMYFAEAATPIVIGNFNVPNIL